MERHNVNLCAAVGILVGMFFIGGKPVRAVEPVSQESGIRWQADLQAAHREAVRLNRPVLIVFGADWCGFCKKLEQESLGHPQIAEYINQTFVPLHLDFDESEREAKILSVQSIPCVLALTPRAELVGRVDGYVAPQKMAEMLGKSLQMKTRLEQARRSKSPPQPKWPPPPVNRLF